MPRGGQWVFDPDSGGQKIKDVVKRDVTRRLTTFAEANYVDKYERIEIRFRSQFCYVDIYQEPALPKDFPPPGFPETREEAIERLRNTPIHLFRLRYFGGDKWGLAFYLYSSEKYELSVYPTGEFFGTPEDALEAAAEFHLT